MKSRLPVILLGVVIFSTAWLTLLAARSLQRDESIAQRHLDERAAKAARTAAALVQARLLGELDQVRNAMSDAASGGGDLARVSAMATRMQDTRGLVRHVYVFMNPWGFMWPADAADSPDENQRRQELVTTLRTRAASSASADEPLGFTSAGKAYLFGACEGRKVLYVGFEIETDTFAQLLRASLREAEGGGVMLGAEGAGLHLEPGRHAAPGQVLVHDSFGDGQVIKGADAHGQPRAVETLPPPMDAVRILAYSENVDEVRRTMAVRNQLTRWGLVMLALGIVGGAALLLSESRAEIRRARSGTDVAVGVSHDLRTPIASMKMLAESLLLGHVREPAKQQEFLRTIVEECERLSQLTERVLFLFRFGQESVQYRLQPADAELAVRRAVEAFRARYVAGGLGDAAPPEVQLHVAPALPRVRLDATAFGQVLLNLLDNAAKYGRTPDSRGATRIAVSVRHGLQRRRPGWPRRPWVSVTVQDHGGGISRRHQRRIFDRFYRVPEHRDANVSGIGLGLSVCRHVITGHGGWIDVHSAPGQGSAFTVHLPAEDHTG